METTAIATHLDNRFTEFNIRQDLGTPHFVRLHDNATRRFEAYVRGLHPARAGAGAGGILLGTVQLTDGLSTTVHDFTPVLCEHRRDGRSNFLDCPAKCFQNAMRRASQDSRKNSSVVGYYRSHTRPEFSLVKEDHDLFRKYFTQDGRFLLLVRPSPDGFATAAFYLSAHGLLDANRCSVEFPLSLRELGAEEPEAPEIAVAIPMDVPIEMAVAVTTAASPVEEPVAAPAATAPEQLVRESRRSEQFWKGAAAAAIVLGSVFAVRSIRTPSAPEARVSSQAPAAIQPAPAVSGEVTNRTSALAPKPAPPVASPEQRPVAPAPAPRSPEPAVPAQRPDARKFSPPAGRKADPAPSVIAPPPELPASRTIAALPAASLPTPPIAAPAIAPVNTPKKEAPSPQAAATAPAPAAAPAGPQGQQTPPRVIRQINPVLSAAVRRKLHGDQTVRILVDVDANGKVTNAVAITKGDKLTDSLAAAAIEAASRSQFEPGTVGDRKVAAQATLQFRFAGETIRLPVQPALR